jgi:hypothetical protein
VNLSECILRVPFGAKERYENADVWKEFGTIVEMRTNAQPTFSPITTGKSGYIFNLSSRKFLNRGEAYGTQSVVAKKGLSYQFRQTNAGNYYLDSDGKILFRTSTDSKVGAGVKTCFYDGTASSKAYWTIVQNPEDNTFTMSIGSFSVPGTYKVGDGEKTVTLTFSKTLSFLCMTGTLESTPTGAKMLFPANKTVALLKKVAAKIGQSSSSVGAIAKLADGYDNFKVGFKMSK